IDGLVRTLQTDQVRHNVLQPNLDWKALLKDCGEADQTDGWVRVAKAEALLEGAGGTLTAREREKTALPMTDILADALEAPYAAYVQALGFNSIDPAKAAAKLVPLFQRNPLPQVLALAQRQKRAAEILVSSALKQRSGG